MRRALYFFIALQGYEAPPASTAAAAPAGAEITFRTVPDPPKTGENQLEATVKDASGKPVAMRW